MPDAFQANAIVPDDALIFCPKGIAGNRFQIMNVKLGCLSVVIFKSLSLLYFFVNSILLLGIFFNQYLTHSKQTKLLKKTLD